MNIYLELFLTFFKIGITTFGGGYAMIGQIKDIVIEKKQWLTNDELLEIIAIAESTPGPIAINMATYVGYKKGKVFGSFCATLGVVLPSFMIIYLISLFLDKFLANQYIAYAFTGMKVGVAFLILRAAYKLIKEMKKDVFQIIIFIITTITMFLISLFSLKFSSINLILIGGVLALIYYSILNYKDKKQVKEIEEKEDDVK